MQNNCELSIALAVCDCSELANLIIEAVERIFATFRSPRWDADQSCEGNAVNFCKRSSWAVIAAICIGLSACDRTDDLLQNSANQGKSRLTGSALTARQVIDECRQAYQKLQSYEDEGYVRLAYRMSGEMLEDRAPLSVGFERPGKLGIRAYSVQAGPTGGRWHLQLRDSGASAVAGQVISRAVPTKADFAWLLSDPAIAEELAAGLAGFPPQLDMLLGPNPMAGLVDSAAVLQLDAPETVNGELCYTLQVTRGPAVYKLWIHQQSMLLRRLQLPNANLTAEMMADKNITNVQLTIELPGIRTDEAVNWDRFAVQFSDESKLVSRFVPAPAPLPLERLGVKVPAFQLKSPQGPNAYSSADSKDKITVLTWLADHPACRETAAQLSAVAASVGASQAADRIQFVTVWAEPDSAAGTTFDNLAKQWNLTGTLAIDSEAVGRDLFGVREAPTVVVLDSDNRLQIFEERANPILPQLLPGLLVRLAGGDDLAAEVIAHARLDQKRHAAELLMAASVDAKRELFERPTSYSASVIGLKKTGTDETFVGDTQAIALSVDDSQMVWTLTSDGRLRREDPSTQAKREFRTRWSIDPSTAARLEVSADGQFLAYSQLNGRTVELFDTSIEQNRIVQLEPNEGVVDLHWMALAGSKSPRLAVLTSNKQTKLLDPNNQEQLSGVCPAPPLALVPQNAADTMVGGYVVMEDRAIERLLLSKDSAIASPLGRPAAFTDKKLADKKMDVGTLPNSKNSVPTKLAFQPAAGPWKSMRTPSGSATLARGWIAQDEPGVFLLNEQLQQQWSYRLPLVTEGRNALIASANMDPATGQALWAITQANDVVHLLRGDGVVTVHVQFDEPIRGLGLVPVGNRLMLYVALAKRITTYQVGR